MSYNNNSSGYNDSWDISTAQSLPLSQMFEQYWLQSPEFSLFWGLKTFVPPLLVVFGAVGNILTVVVIQRHQIRSCSVGYYLTLLLTVYTFQLLCVCGYEWVYHVTENALLKNRYDSVCRVSIFVFNVVDHSPYWILVLMLADRTILLWSPVSSSVYCTLFVARLSTVWVVVGLLTVNIHVMWTYELGYYGCSIDPRQRDFYTTIWPWLSASLNCYMPLLVILLSLFIILIGVCLRREQDFAINHRYVSVTASVAVAFFLLTTPSVVVNLIHYAQPIWLRSFKSYAQLYTLAEFCNALAWLNNSVLWVICLQCVSQLSMEMKRLCGGSCSHGDSEPAAHDGMLLAGPSVASTQPPITAV